ncbi:hypothetical protein ILYODFUR_033544 [Ilyodon furcidens]|uniref:Uncharacterized protein n=1 Tax=Ilyodon furcidens TaxID=33524 RepID=A0ABV0UEJ1_9TELE
MPEVGYSVSYGSSVPVQAGYYQPAAFMLVYDASSQQTGAAQSSLREAKWKIAPQAFEEASTDTQDQGSSVFGPPPGPALQSGEMSNIVKETELGNFHHQTEEFGYPAIGPVQGFLPVVLQSPGVWGYPSPYPLPYPFPYPYPDFDYRLLYGLYPPGTYTTFSKEHEKGRDYYQTIHYLKEHGSDAPDAPQNPGTGQPKVFTGAP